MNSRIANWALFTTNWGRTAIKALELYQKGKLHNVEINLVVYENLPSGAAEYAQNIGIRTERVIRSNFESRELYETHLLNLLKSHGINYIFLLGYGYLIKEDLLTGYQNSIINIHPSLLPAFKGKNAIQQAMEYGVRVSGITTHFIDSEMDEGKIICQQAIDIDENESFEEIDSRYMKECKKILLRTFTQVTNL